MSVFRRRDENDRAHTRRVLVERSPAYQDFAAQGTHPHLTSWDATALPAGTGQDPVELWTSVEAVPNSPFRYPFVLAVFAPDGRLVRLVTAETMPTVHGDVFLGVFQDGNHANLGSDPGLLDREHFVSRALALAAASAPPGRAGSGLVASCAGGQYALAEPLARGGFATVYRAVSPGGDPVLVKVGLPQGGSGDGTRGEFFPASGYFAITGGRSHHTFSAAEVDDVLRAEAALLRMAAGRRLPRLLDEGTVAGRPALVLEPYPARWPFEQADPEGFAGVLDALADLASAGVAYHGDLKPEHIYRDRAGRIAFVDPAFRGHPSLGTITPEFNPWRLLGPAGDVVAIAVLMYTRYAGAVPTMFGSGSIPPLGAVSPAPVGVAEWVDQLLDRRWALAGGFGVGTDEANSMQVRTPWAFGHASAAAELRARLSRPIVETAAHVMPRTRSRISTVIPIGWYSKESWTILAPDGQANVIVSSEPLDPSIDTTRYATIQGELLQKEFSGFHELAFVPFTAASSHVGYLRDFQWTPPNGVAVRQLQVYFALDGRGFTATATTPTGNMEAARGALEAILRSLRIGE